MRTKTLLLAAALSAAGLATSLAQSNVYSLNVVGYINLVMTNGTGPNPIATPGLSLVSAPLLAGGAGTQNTVTGTLGTNHANLTKIYRWDGTQWIQKLFNAGAWIGGGDTASVNPGEGFMYANVTTTPVTVTIVGEVLQGALSVPVSTSAAIALVSSKVPQAGPITTLGYASTTGQDRIFRFNKVVQAGYNQYLAVNGAWAGGNIPNLEVGEAVLQTGNATTTWNRNFTVQ